MLLDLRKTAHRILDRDLYSFLLEDIREWLGEDSPTEQDVLRALESEPRFLAEYRRLNRENDISNIDLVELEVRPDDSATCAEKKRRLNEVRRRLISLEGYSEPPSWVTYSMWIGFFDIIVLFVAHNVVAMYTDLYRTAEAAVFTIYGVLAALGVVAVVYAYKRHEGLRRAFLEQERTYESLAREAIQQGCIRERELYGRGE